MLTVISRIIHYGFKNFWRNGWLSTVTVAIMVLALLVFGGLIIFRTVAREAAMFIPNLVGLFRGLLADPRVPWHAKALLAVALAYVAWPIDLIPEFIPIAGPLDDAIVAGLALAYVLRVAGSAVILEHWRGDPAVIARILGPRG